MSPTSNNNVDGGSTTTKKKTPSPPKSSPFFAIEQPSASSPTESQERQQQTTLTPAQRILQGPAATEKQQIASNFDGGSFEPTPENLISKARVVVATDFGILDPSVLSDDDDGINQFLWIRPLADKPLGRIDYLAAGRFFNLRGTFPNLDWRCHDFRIDVNDPLTVRVTGKKKFSSDFIHFVLFALTSCVCFHLVHSINHAIVLLTVSFVVCRSVSLMQYQTFYMTSTKCDQLVP